MEVILLVIIVILLIYFNKQIFGNYICRDSFSNINEVMLQNKKVTWAKPVSVILQYDNFLSPITIQNSIKNLEENINNNIFTKKQILKKTKQNANEKKELFSQVYDSPYIKEDGNDSINADYYYDKSGLKPTMYRLLPPLMVDQPIPELQKKLQKEDHFNSIVNLLGIYDQDVYQNCNPVPPMYS